MLLNQKDEDWQDTVLRIIEWSCQHWGGGYFIFIPTDGNRITPLFWSILDAYDPDYVYSYSKTLLDWKIAKPDKYNEWLDGQVQAFCRTNPDSDPAFTRQSYEDQAGHVSLDDFGIGTELKGELRQRLVPFHYEEHVVQGSVFAGAGPDHHLTSLTSLLLECDHPSTMTTIVPPEDNYLRLIVAAMAGSLGANFLEKLKTLGVSEKPLILDTSSSGILSGLALDQRVEEALTPSLPFWFSMLALGYYRRPGFEQWLAPCFVIVGNTLEDFCLFYSLSRLGGEAVWVPDAFVQDISCEGQGFPAGVFEKPTTSFLFSLVNKVSTRVCYERPNTKLVVTSASKQLSELTDVGKALSKLVGFEPHRFLGALLPTADISEFLESPRIVLEKDNYRSTVEPFIGGQTGGSFQTPRPKNFQHVHPHEHKWITEVVIERNKLPRVRQLGERAVLIRNYGTLNVRTGRDALAYFCPNIAYFGGDIDTVLVRPKLATVDALQLFSFLFQGGGRSLSLSEKGNFTQESIAKLGSLQDFAALLSDASTCSVFEKFLDPAPNKPGVFNEGVLLGDRRYLNFGAVEELTGDPKRAADLVDRMAECSVLYRGFVFKCERCRNADWYDVQDVSQTFECKRCRCAQVYQQSHWRQPLEPQWYFKLDEVVYQALKSGSATTILALDALRKKAKDTFDSIPEFEIRKSPDDPKPIMEIDFGCNLDGLIILGEAKKEGRLGRNEGEEDKKLENYKVAATAIRASQVVFATSDNHWAEATQTRVREAFEGTGIITVFLCKADM